MGIKEEEKMGMAPCLHKHNRTSLLALEEEEVAMVGVEKEKTMGMAPCLYRH